VDGRNALNSNAPRVARGGSWYDRPYRAGAAYRLPYQPWQRVYNVGFRVIIEMETPTTLAAEK
jgi:formylglycine-generating enzyme required for sulfatase activity